MATRILEEFQYEALPFRKCRLCWLVTLSGSLIGRKGLEMKTLRFALTLFLAVALIALPSFAVSVNAQDPQAQNQATALMRGYRPGYTDGFQAGIPDSINHGARDFRGKPDYQHADRAYNSNYGAL